MNENIRVDSWIDGRNEMNFLRNNSLYITIKYSDFLIDKEYIN